MRKLTQYHYFLQVSIFLHNLPGLLTPRGLCSSCFWYFIQNLWLLFARWRLLEDYSNILLGNKLSIEAPDLKYYLYVESSLINISTQGPSRLTQLTLCSNSNWLSDKHFKFKISYTKDQSPDRPPTPSEQVNSSLSLISFIQSSRKSCWKSSTFKIH